MSDTGQKPEGSDRLEDDDADVGGDVMRRRQYERKRQNESVKHHNRQGLPLGYRPAWVAGAAPSAQ